MCLTFHLCGHSGGFNDPRGAPLSALWLLYYYNLIILSWVARMAQATFPGRYLLSGRAEVTVTVPILGKAVMRTYGRLLACPGKCEACSRGTHIFRVYSPPFCSR